MGASPPAAFVVNYASDHILLWSLAPTTTITPVPGRDQLHGL
jgi:hypothetical protein